MIEYSECKWCGVAITRYDDDPDWYHRGSWDRYCHTTVAAPPDNFGRCTECNAADWRKCGCTMIVAQDNARGEILAHPDDVK